MSIKIVKKKIQLDAIRKEVVVSSIKKQVLGIFLDVKGKII